MHIARIHEMLETLTKVACEEMSKDVKCIDTKELGEVVDMVKDLCDSEYKATLVKTMSEGEYRMTPEMFKEHSAEWYRDMDLKSKNIRYYTEPMAEMSKSEKARQKYSEDRTQENFDHFTKELMNELTDLWGTLDNASRTMMKARINTLMSKMA
jgi:hypothetical protein